MFQMTIEHSIRLHDNLTTIAGPCVNKHEFTNRLIDEEGNAYEAHIPLDVTLVFNDAKILLGITGEYNAEALKGRVLSGN